jgi:tetratricopeptide (TPR) repeat protein
VDASTLETIESGFQDIARYSGMGNTAQDALRWFSQQHEEWLVIFDNADDPDVNLREFFPPCSHGNIIITTRNEACRSLAPNHNVSRMDPVEAVNLLLASSMMKRSQENLNLALSVVKELGYLALAIAQVGAYISRSCSLTEYLSIYHENRAELLHQHAIQSTDDYEWTVYTTWEISLKKLGPAATAFLKFCTFLHYNGISKAIFHNASSTRNPGNTFNNATDFLRMFQETDGSWSDFRFQEVINELLSYSLINVGARDNEYSIHRLVHAWARDHTSITEPQTRNCVMQILALSIELNHNSNSTDDLAFRRTLIPHIDESLANDIDCDPADRFQLAYYENGRWNMAAKLQLQIVAERTKVLGQDHPDTVMGMSNLAVTYWKQGRWKEAERLWARIVAARKRVLGEDHPHTLMSMSNLAYTYWNQGRLKEAEQLGEQVLGARQRILGEGHPDTLMSMNNLTLTYWKQGRLTEAEQLGMQVIEARKNKLGDNHPDTLMSMSNLALTYLKQGRLKEAEELGAQAVASRIRVLGANHHATLKSMNHLANTYRSQGRLQDAGKLGVQVLWERKRVLGEEHLDTLDSMDTLAKTYNDQGWLKEAEDLGVRALETRKKALGEEHFDTLDSMHTLASIYSNQDRLTEARDLGARVLEARERVLGENHPDTLASAALIQRLDIACDRWEELFHLQNFV